MSNKLLRLKNRYFRLSKQLPFTLYDLFGFDESDLSIQFVAHTESNTAYPPGASPHDPPTSHPNDRVSFSTWGSSVGDQVSGIKCRGSEGRPPTTFFQEIEGGCLTLRDGNLFCRSESKIS